MYQPAHLDSFLRLLISHLESVVTQGERLKEWRSSQTPMDVLLDAIEHGEDTRTHQKTIDLHRDNETLFVLQMSQSREWVDRLGQLDPDLERQTDEFLAATYSIEKFMNDHGNKRILGNDRDRPLDIDGMMCAIIEFLGRLEEQYDLMEELFEVMQVVNGVPFGQNHSANESAKIIPFNAKSTKTLSQDNEPKR